MPSCMRAPPVAETTTSARRSAIATSIERATFSPTTEPMLPPMKKKSMTVRLAGLPSIVATPAIAASFCPVSRCAVFRRSGYRMRASRNSSGSAASRSANRSWKESGSVRIGT